MKVLALCWFILGLAACSSGGADSCETNPLLCVPDCTLSGTCAGVDGGGSDAGVGDAGGHDAGRAVASLLSLQVTPGKLSPAFSPTTNLYKVLVSASVDEVRVTATPKEPSATLELNGVRLSAGVPSAPIAIGPVMTTILVTVQGPNEALQSYSLVVMRSAGPDYLKASNTDTNDVFGGSISLSGDTLAVGAMAESSKATGVNGDQADNSLLYSGAVYVFQRTKAGWVQQAYLKSSNPDEGDRFGQIVSLSGDTLAVGSFQEDSKAKGVNGDQLDNSASLAGAVYVFQRTGTSWVQQAYLKASNTDANDWFGAALSLSGDTLAVGSRYEASKATGINGDQADNSATHSGAVYVFQRSGTTWAQQAYLKASNTEANDEFGYTVSLSGDTLAVTAFGEASKATGINGDQRDNSAAHSGAVYVFQRSGTTWAQQAYLKASNTETNDWFGWGLTLSGNTLAVSAIREDSKATGPGGAQSDNSCFDSGAVYVFQRSGTTWLQQAYLKASNTGAEDLFGTNLSLAGDTLLVGTYSEDSKATGSGGDETDDSAPKSGAVYRFQRTGSSWAQQAYIKAPNTNEGDSFGVSVSVSGSTMAVGASGEASKSTGADGDQLDNSAMLSGAVYFFQ